MKNKILDLLISVAFLASAGCSKKFLEETKPYNQYGEDQAFSNETLAGWYIDRVYNYFFVNYRNPLEQVVGLYKDDRSMMTEEIGGTVIDYTNPLLTLQTASDADTYYGKTTSSVNNNPYTRIRFCNDIIEKMDQPIAKN